ncbi:MAG: hypothetical protein FWE18_04465 [Alphaproteobacteria bacterium]|nr:hypothetical protein [Alphaproteobacteria bacterium]
MENNNYKISTAALTGLDGKAFNAVINAMRAGNYVAFSAHYTDSFKDFFTKSYIEEDGKQKDLALI